MRVFPVGMGKLSLVVFLALGGLAQSWAGAAVDYAGEWTTTYGPLTLSQSGTRVSGQYGTVGTPCLVEGTVTGRRLAFTYREPDAEGEGWFEMAEDGQSFAGRWRETGEARWSRWTGARATAKSGPVASFAGTWNSTYGPLRLRQQGTVVRGFYRMRDGRFAEVAGTATGTVLVFSYDECGVKGTGRFTLEPSGAAFKGTWRDAKGGQGEWTGARLEAKPGRIWLVVLEARWEESLSDREFAYGTMLGAYFARAENIECRHRFFDDADSLKRACSEIPFLPEPVVVAIASHGNEEGIVVGHQTIDAVALAECFARAGNVMLLHFSSCLAMAGQLPAEIQKQLPAGISFPMSGYATAVDWGGSAAAEFIYLDLVLAREMEPAEAARQLVKLMPIAGDHAPAGAPFEPLGFRFLPGK